MPGTIHKVLQCPRWPCLYIVLSQNEHFKKAMTRYGLADNSIVDYLYISNKLYLGQPSRRLKVIRTAVVYAPVRVLCPAACFIPSWRAI